MRESSRRRGAALLGAALLGAAALGGCFPREGEGQVRAAFTVTDCPPGDDNDGLRDYGYEPALLGLTRFNEDINIQLLEHPVLVEETDGLAIKLRLTPLLDAGSIEVDPATERYGLTAPPLELPLSLDGLGARASLSLFQTCADFPTVHAVSGTLRFDVLEIAVDPQDLGHDERIEGTLTASIARGSPAQAVGILTADFAFDVPRRPLLTVQ